MSFFEFSRIQLLSLRGKISALFLRLLAPISLNNFLTLAGFLAFSFKKFRVLLLLYFLNHITVVLFIIIDRFISFTCSNCFYNFTYKPLWLLLTSNSKVDGCQQCPKTMMTKFELHPLCHQIF